MGSKRKRNEKKKDFQKTKLKVGKTQAKPDNYTDTSFTAKSIVLPGQTISKKRDIKDESVKEQIDLTHHLSLTKHHSASTRKEVLNYIENHLPANTSSFKQILTMTLSLISDPSASVRDAFISLLSACADKQPGFLELNMRSIVLFVHSAMTHIKSDIRGTSTKVLNILVTKAPDALVKGHFVKTLRSYFSLMAWTLSNDKKSVSLAANASDTLEGSGRKARFNHLETLEKILLVSLFQNSAPSMTGSIDWTKCSSIHPQTQSFMIPSNPQAYSQLKLYIDELPLNPNTNLDSAEGSFTLVDIENISTEDQETRRKILFDVFLHPLRKNLKDIVKEGGEVGKAAVHCTIVLDRFEKEYLECQAK